jgi:hypothetical protein
MAKRKKKKAKKSGAKKSRGKTKDSLVVASKVKAYVRGKGYIASGDLIGAVNEAVYGMLDSATNRTDANKRSTVRPQDI